MPIDTTYIHFRPIYAE